MKKIEVPKPRKGCLLFSVVLLLQLFITILLPATTFAGTITLEHPVDKYNGSVQFAPGRDFVVQGRLLDFAGIPLNVRITLQDEQGKTVRSLCSTVNAQGYTDPALVDVSQVGSFGALAWTNDSTALKNNPSPDLVKDKTLSSNKIVVNSAGQYAAIIFGGMASNSGIYEPGDKLANGSYILRVAALDTIGQEVATASETIKIGVSNMVCARFSPSQADGYPHFENVKQFAQANNLKIMLDPFPAFWSQKATPTSAPVFYENLKIWRVNDLAEYLYAPQTYVIMYNVAGTSATQNVELGGLVYNKFLQNATPKHVVYFYRYDIGDTSVSYAKKNGKIVTKNGALVDFDGKHRTNGYNQLAITRAERRADNIATVENLYNPRDLQKTIDTKVSDGVDLKPHQTLSLFGVVTPLATDSVVYDAASESFAVNNYLAKLHYEITGPGGVVTRRTLRTIGLTRQYKENSKAASLYEFKHDFPAQYFPHAGVYKIKVQGLDTKGEQVKDASAAFNIIVRE